MTTEAITFRNIVSVLPHASETNNFQKWGLDKGFFEVISDALVRSSYCAE
ncbi:MAG: lipoate synthase [Pseudomonadales bacterium]|jgi:lipoate synthase